MALTSIGVGLLSTLRADSNKAAWICFQVVSAGGGGIVAATTLPAILAELPESDVATASGAFSSVRSLGRNWGVTLASNVSNGRFDNQAPCIGDAGVQAQLVNGAAYGYTSGHYVRALLEGSKQQVIGVYVDALQIVWHVLIAIACLGFFCAFLQRHVELRVDLDTKYGLDKDGIDS